MNVDLFKCLTLLLTSAVESVITLSSGTAGTLMLDGSSECIVGFLISFWVRVPLLESGSSSL